MFGISLVELLIIIILLIIFINPQEYLKIYKTIMYFVYKFKYFYKSTIKELDLLKEQSGLNKIDEELKDHIDEVDNKRKKVTGSDGKLYDSYDISEFLKREENKN